MKDFHDCCEITVMSRLAVIPIAGTQQVIWRTQ